MAVVKWDLPPEPIPSWLDPSKEVTSTNDGAKPTIDVFIPGAVDSLLSLGCSMPQATEVAANTISEIGYKLKYRANNCGGWKINKDSAQGYEKKHGKKPLWWRAPGNKSSGDPPWCYYRGFESLAQFFAEWLRKFVPKPDSLPPAPAHGTDPFRYRKTGAAFWGDLQADWFAELIAAGYKGEITRAHPRNSILNHEILNNEACEWWCQSKLRQTLTDPQEKASFSVDGAWGPRSKAALVAFLKAHGLPVTEVPDVPSMEALRLHTTAHPL